MAPDASGPDHARTTRGDAPATRTPETRTPAPRRRRAGRLASLLSALRRRRSTRRPGDAETLPDMETTTTMTDLETARTRLETHLGELAGQDLLVCLDRSEEHTSELQSRGHLVCRLLLEKKTTSREDMP